MAGGTYVDRCPQLEQSDSLTSLRLSLSSYAAGEQTLRAVARSSTLRELCLVCGEGDEGVGLLCREMLLPNSSLESLKLDLKECSHEGILQLVRVVRGKEKLKRLSLLLNNVGEEGACSLSEVATGPHLEEFSLYATQLDLHDKSIGDAGVAVLCKALQTPRKLHSLCIAQSGVTGAGVESLISTLHTNKTITHLDLNSNQIDSEGAISLAQHLKSTTCKLYALILDSNHKIGNDGAKAIALALCENSSLQVLRLGSCDVGKRGAERFATALSQNETLQELGLRGNVEVGDQAVELISRGLRANRGLHKLDLSSCGVGDEGCAHLAEALLENQVLESLLLHKNSISDGGLMALCQTMAKKSHLKTLVLTENRFGEQGTTTLLNCLQHNTSLTTLTVDTPTVGGANTLGLLLAKNAQLQQYRQLALQLRRDNYALQEKLDKCQKRAQVMSSEKV